MAFAVGSRVDLGIVGVGAPIIRAVAWMLTPSTKADMTASRLSPLVRFISSNNACSFRQWQ